ncbi:Cys-tRNA(Pro)/Cys-tRNA(Cys) deacylase ybaK [Mycobacteroides abscessus subsp. bolletii]|uniref:YbaK/EbsC family protein n=1 Tax=Mycobacteroides abscessus TaxID=36809 RepID=UPI0009A8832F|nr:YbaK/EbsC family protein [Mycobacteroides abscessus]SLI56891.1 Cys-tRNA(Pro)/Cys-tRNA(Cys) deacylase ybaK [Mycobacteroides abscessus subsp. bolletii]
MTEVLPETSRQLQATLAGLGCRGRIRQLPDSTHSATDAAAAVGCAIGAIASSLLFMADDSPLLVMASGAHRVDTDRVAQLVGALKVRLAPAKSVAKITGQVVGGVAPVGHPNPIRTLVDSTLEKCDEIWAAGGTPRTVFPLTFAELVRITGGQVCEVA